MANYSTLPPNAKGKIEPFKIHVEEQKLQDFKTLVKSSPIVKDTYENQKERISEGHNWGITRQWLIDAKKYWETQFDWRKQEAHLNSFPHFKTSITDDDGREYSIHFVALFSKKKDAIPLARLSGWPCSFAESLPLVTLLQEKYTPESLPYHIILPSQPGWTFSSPPPLDRDWNYADSARILHKLMLNLGFGSGYTLSGGDIGAGIARIMASTYPEVKALHTNYAQIPRPDDATDAELQDFERDEGVPRGDEFMKSGTAYGRMQGTRPATLSAVLASSPLAILAWIGEKYLEWVDPSTPIPLPHILQEVCLYWFSECFATTFYPYREDFEYGIYQKGYLHGQKHLYVDKPYGYSYFPKELVPAPKAWAERSGKLVWYRKHDVGGHFPSLERSGVLLGDVEDFLGQVWK
ncbi:hypothetical protein N0V90_003807 [Kalmusia sp. IMI 367209]|nr:hypothetical protein N0V90_003807 [Kalmusia sp. IMI 367209]